MESGELDVDRPYSANYLRTHMISFLFQGCLSTTPYLHQPNNFCYDVCPSGYYENTVTLTCSPCPYDCNQCGTGGACTSCSNTTHHREASGSRCVPVEGYYDTGVAVAATCDSSCKTCSGTSTNCTSCNSGTTLSNNSCVCASGYVLSGGNCVIDCSAVDKCLSCIVNSSRIDCTQCITNYEPVFLYNTNTSQNEVRCVAECGTGIL
jgi:hypothetical protein